MELLDPLPTSCKYVLPMLSPNNELFCRSFIVFILDLVGRRKPLLFGAGSFVCTFSILAAIVATNPPTPENNPNAWPVNHTAQR